MQTIHINNILGWRPPLSAKTTKQLNKQQNNQEKGNKQMESQQSKQYDKITF